MLSTIPKDKCSHQLQRHAACDNFKNKISLLDKSSSACEVKGHIHELKGLSKTVNPRY